MLGMETPYLSQTQRALKCVARADIIPTAVILIHLEIADFESYAVVSV